MQAAHGGIVSGRAPSHNAAPSPLANPYRPRAPNRRNRPVSIRMWKRIGAMLVALVTFSPAGAQTLQKLVFATD